VTDRLRLATYNIEWFNNLFNDAGDLLDDLHWSGRWGVTRRDQIAALGAVFAAMDADAVMVIEAPDAEPERPVRVGFGVRHDYDTTSSVLRLKSGRGCPVQLALRPPNFLPKSPLK